jgi:uncharacterized integral membrane protein
MLSRHRRLPLYASLGVALFFGALTVFVLLAEGQAAVARTAAAPVGRFVLIVVLLIAVLAGLVYVTLAGGRWLADMRNDLNASRAAAAARAYLEADNVRLREALARADETLARLNTLIGQRTQTLVEQLQAEIGEPVPRNEPAGKE